MLFLVDECYPHRLVNALAALGHDAVWGPDVCKSLDDAAVLAWATSVGRIIVSEDRGFGDHAVRDGKSAIGIVVAHSDQFPGRPEAAMGTLAAKIDELGQRLVGHITIIEPNRVRQRALP